ncbi:hypothetical protein SSSM5_130 [Synechococcus phage S-SSM5]|jgi:hypothetical protein|uniref:Uncharacterized protein n=1 Tax=Synechococcus phage S-SSM5 TaxID=445685 RepID=E3SKH0_9CAUD|nr:hypothetical protein SSSM5_130 [Synechococcus phage S-SSM5]ADO97940.1 hypothetical protein SSSM5_130 [Synechococcus phage S-SSM5]|tara:strand:+ start:909 stop:1103 length:195 start_codon:yes stop_codon:yes gene_type:complete
MDYKPYSPEWHRKRYLEEAIFKYLDDYVANDIIINDIKDILHSRSDEAYQEYIKLNDLESKLTS